MTRLLSPFLSFTANEAWQSLHQKEHPADPTIFEQEAHDLPSIAQADTLLHKWQSIRAVRAEVLKAIEVEREAGQVGSSLGAGVSITAGAAIAEILQSLGDDLKFVMITSDAVVHANTSLEPMSVEVNVAPLSYAKCDRCWHLRADVGANTDHPTLCGRCVSNLFGQGERRAIA
jgi:isoleucyl-tRNA synthetase